MRTLIYHHERLDLYLKNLLGKRVGLVANQTSKVKKEHLVDVLLNEGVNVVKVFSPEEQIYNSSKLHGRILIVSEEPSSCSFSLGLSGAIQKNCFEFLDAPVEVIGSENTPAIPLNEILETEYLPNAEKVITVLSRLLEY